MTLEIALWISWPVIGVLIIGSLRQYYGGWEVPSRDRAYNPNMPFAAVGAFWPLLLGIGAIAGISWCAVQVGRLPVLLVQKAGNWRRARRICVVLPGARVRK